ncbi:MAG TPA: hypothetical protein VLQ89_09240, partial [Candidatus Binatia bacterium]|nr:hypothetical protein [Candidatus Binatia bacterium]
MEKTVDPWREIGLLIGKEKEKALAEFRDQKFEVTSASAVSPTGRPFGMMMRHPASLAAAASFFLAVGLVLFLFLNGSWQTAPVASGMDVLLADSFLYNLGRDPEMKKPEPRAKAIFFPQFAAWGEAAGMNRADAPVE